MKVVAVIVGLLVAMGVLMITEFIGHKIYPFAPPDLMDKQKLVEFVASLPPMALAFPLLGGALGSLIGGLIATLLSKKYMEGFISLRPALMVGLIMTILAVLNLVMIPHPYWYLAATFIAYIPFAYIGAKLALTSGK
jgi:hypothetical protein